MAAVGEWWNQVSGTVLHGLEVTAVGMVLVFFTLGLVILAMVLLTKLPWLQSKPATQGPEPETQAASPVVQLTTQSAPKTSPQRDELAQVAAITVALLRGRRATVRQVAAKSTRSSWRSYGRAHQLGL